jgi:hypothetical protein
LQHGFVSLNDADFVGWQWTEAASITKGNFEGLQTSFVNYAGFANGVQIGVVNYAVSAKGVQFGLVNYVGSMKGLQIGLVNIIRTGGTFPFFPIVNWSF